MHISHKATQTLIVSALVRQAVSQRQATVLFGKADILLIQLQLSHPESEK
jgi:hypothetical protein